MSHDLPYRATIRLSDFDYSSPNWYYVTICTKDRMNVFVGAGSSRPCDPAGSSRPCDPAGSSRPCDPSSVQISLSPIGHIVNWEWLKLRVKYPQIDLDQFVIMPNHIHGIIVIKPGRENRAPTLGQIIAYFKYQTTKQYNISVGAGSSRPCDPAGSSRPFSQLWQRNYYEHIIRNAEELTHVRKYISDNPKNWENDKLFNQLS